MILRWFVAAVHLLAFGGAVAACWTRAERLRGLASSRDFRGVFAADNLYGVCALLSIATGLWRAFGTIEKGSGYYLSHPFFLVKMGLYTAVFLLELQPMATLLRWRLLLRRGGEPDLSSAPRLAGVSRAEAWMMAAMALCATAVARGIFV